MNSATVTRIERLTPMERTRFGLIVLELFPWLDENSDESDLPQGADTIGEVEELYRTLLGDGVSDLRPEEWTDLALADELEKFATDERFADTPITSAILLEVVKRLNMLKQYEDE